VVNVYIDSDLVVSRLLVGHVHHAVAAAFFREVRRRRMTPVISSHGLAEVFSVLTRIPPPGRIPPAAAWQMLEANIVPLFKIQALDDAEYIELLRNCAAQGLLGGQVYDAVHVHAARKAKCARIYTFNVIHFRHIAPDLHDRVVSP
jgi:predicted nucleic acid-binding protein